jgi:RNA polymerase sigma-70 factor (ECF subfamily)
MTPEESFRSLMARLRAGENDAAAQLFNRFATQLAALARGRLDKQADAEDVMQSVFLKFFLRLKQDAEPRNWDDSWHLLTILTVHECNRRNRPPSAEVSRCDLGVEGFCGEGGDGADGTDVWGVPDRAPTPEEAAVLTDKVRKLLRQLEPRYHQAVILRLQGRSCADIAQEAGLSERTVYRILQRVREELQRCHFEDNGEKDGEGA